MSAGRRLFKELEPNFRDALGSPPNLGNAPVGHAPAPSTVRQAHIFDSNSNRSTGYAGSVARSAQPARNSLPSDVEVSAEKSASEKVEIRGKDCNASGLSAREVKYPARRGVSHRASIFDEHGLKLVLGSTANRVLSDDEARDFASFLGRIE